LYIIIGKRGTTHFVKNHFIEIPKGDSKVEIQNKFCKKLSRDTHGITLFGEQQYCRKQLFAKLSKIVLGKNDEIFLLK
jgi:hypothetical protein